MNKLDFKEITDFLSINYSKQLDVKMLNLWYEELKTYSKERYEFAVREIIKNENFMPNLSKIYEYIKKPDWLNMDIPENKASEEEIKKLEERMKR